MEGEERKKKIPLPRKPKFKAPPVPLKKKKLRSVKSFVVQKTTTSSSSPLRSVKSFIRKSKNDNNQVPPPTSVRNALLPPRKPKRSISATPPPISRHGPLRSIKSFVHKKKLPVPPPRNRSNSPSWSQDILTRTSVSAKPKRRRPSSIEIMTRSKGVFIFKWSSRYVFF